jgi:hypothetical protein
MERQTAASGVVPHHPRRVGCHCARQNRTAHAKARSRAPGFAFGPGLAAVGDQLELDGVGVPDA